MQTLRPGCEEVLSGSAVGSGGVSRGTEVQPVQGVIQPGTTVGAGASEMLRGARGERAGVLRPLVLGSSQASGLPQGTREDLEAREDLQGKKRWCWQWEARARARRVAPYRQERPGPCEDWLLPGQVN